MLNALSRNGRDLSYSRWVIAAFILALAVRLVYVLALPAPKGLAELSFDDEKAYVTVAQNFRAGLGFVQEPGEREASKAPGYPFILALCNPRGEFPAFARTARITQALAAACACLLVWLLCRRVFGEKAAVAGAFIAAIYPFAVFYCGLLLSETFFIAVFLGAILLLDMADEGGIGNRATPVWRRRVAAAILAGLLLGLATLIRPTSLYFLPFYLPFWLAKATIRHPNACLQGQSGIQLVRRGGNPTCPPGRKSKIAETLVLFAVAFLAFCVTMSPWITRNVRRFHAFVPATLQSGESLYEGNSPYATGGPGWQRVPWEKESGGRMMDELENDRFWHQKAVQWIKAHPLKFMQLALVKFARTWSPIPNYEAARTPFYIAVSLASCVPVMVFGVIGLILCLRDWRRWLLLIVPIVYYSAVHSVTVGSIRYREPAMPFIIMFTGCGVAWLWSRARKSGDKALKQGIRNEQC